MTDIEELIWGHHRRVYEGLRSETPELPAWEDLTDEQRDHIRETNRAMQADFNHFGKMISEGKTPSSMEEAFPNLYKGK